MPGNSIHFDTMLNMSFTRLPSAGDAVMRGLAAACDASLAMPFRNHLDELHAVAFRHHVSDNAPEDGAADAAAALKWAELFLMCCAAEHSSLIRRRAANAYTLVHDALAEKVPDAPVRNSVLSKARGAGAAR